MRGRRALACTIKDSGRTLRNCRFSIAGIRHWNLEIRNSQNTPLRLGGDEFRFSIFEFRLSALTISHRKAAVPEPA